MLDVVGACPNMAGSPGLKLGWCEDDCVPTQRLSFGELPNETVFRDRFSFAMREIGKDADSTFAIKPGHGSSVAFEGDWTCDELWDIVQETCAHLAAGDYSEEEWDDENGELQIVSSVLYVLRIEWI